MLKTSFSIFCVALIWPPTAPAEIYRCTDTDGNAMFSQTPCVQEKDDSVEAGVEEEAAENPAISTTEANPEPRDEQAVAQCKKPYRDAIDEIDAEMKDGYSDEQGEVFKQRLRGLTEQLRRCEA